MTRVARFRALAVLLSSVFFPDAGIAQVNPFYNRFDWPAVEGFSPWQFRADCQPGNFIRKNSAADISCYGPNLAARLSNSERVNRSFREALLWMDRLGFRSPDGLGPVVPKNGTDGPLEIRLGRKSDPSGVGFASMDPCISAPGDQLQIKINPGYVSTYPQHMTDAVAAHELFHAIDHKSGQLQYCTPPFGRPDWISEGVADTVATAFAIDQRSLLVPISASTRDAAGYLGVRPYNLPLNFPFEDFESVFSASFQYRTSSFWNYIVAQHYPSTPKFLQDWLATDPPGLVFEEHEKWLDQHLDNDPYIDRKLAYMYPAFLTDFHGQSQPGGIAEDFDTTLYWEQSIFGGCQRVTIGADEIYAEFELDINQYAGRCFHVQVLGLSDGDFVNLKIGALTNDVDLMDELHLGWSVARGARNWVCAELERKSLLARGRYGCLMTPVSGVFETNEGGEVFAPRLWYGSSVELGTGGDASAQASSYGEVFNTYVVSRAPIEPRAMRKQPLADPEDYYDTRTIRLAAGIDFATLEIDGMSVNTSGGTGDIRVRATAAMGLRPSESDPGYPAVEGFIHSGQAERIFGASVAQYIEANRDIIGFVQNAMPGQLDTGFVAFRVAESEVTAAATPFPMEPDQVGILREFAVMLEEPLAPGQTGTFEAAIIGTDRARPGIGYFPNGDMRATLLVLENSKGAFRAAFSGSVCEYLASVPQSLEDCGTAVTVAGSISKPFNFLYDRENPVTVIRPPGQRMYDTYHGGEAVRFDPFGPLLGDPEISVAEPEISVGVRVDQACDCTCPDKIRPATPECVLVCTPTLTSCISPDIATSDADHIRAQRDEFARILGGMDLPEGARGMLVEDFSKMSAPTRDYLIETYRARAEP